MTRRAQVMAAIVAVLFSVACGRRAPADDPMRVPPDYEQRVEAWRAQHEADYRRDWATVAGLHFLDPGTFTLGRASSNDIVLEADVPDTIGRLAVDDEGRVSYMPDPAVTVEQDGQRVTGTVTLKAPGEAPAPEVRIGEVRLVAHTSGDRLALRVRDPNSAPARAFPGFSWFPIDHAYRITGRFVPDATPRPMQVVNTFGDLDTYPSEGVIEFAVHGETMRIRPFTTRPGRFYIVFRDASAGEETYETARFLYADLERDDTVVLDFNEAYNPPCAFNPYTTCPIPLRENVLPVKILAGERAYAPATAPSSE